MGDVKTVTAINMDCRKGMAAMLANSLDSIVTDPPYGLSKQPDIVEVLTHWLAGDDYTATGGGFMGKKWDSFVPGPLTWAEAFRVLKPGGYIACFAGSRTVDLMSISLRLGGFEVVDMCHWLYGVGFPKSMDISKAIDGHDAVQLRLDRAYAFTAWFRPWVDMSNTEIDKICGTKTLARHWTDCRPNGKQPEVITREHFEKLRPHRQEEVPLWVELLIEERTVESRNSKQRKVTGQHKDTAQAAEWRASYAGGEVQPPGLITEAHTDEAKQWEGWGTALKPCHEPIIIARKPLEGTYANNVLAHGVGALNIDRCRLPGDRWPGNVMHDGCLPDPMDRYFYSAKASQKDREAGLELMKLQAAASITERDPDSAGHNNPRAGTRGADRANIHPTVKPTELMRWLCLLVTPPGGTVGDPFYGSGSTGRGAILEGFNVIGFEQSAEYCAIANAREADALKEASR
jgi:DNA modification methylase